ncbi:MAG: type III pantothenate kinase [Armatimonadota bacterium]|nr:type III pantothenate kinase [Armatimonadota bacterium]MDR7427311.1 type III pantothenate kinase [Armatimonadota bacterium]MDR7463869.1 type III pantothenate kinase [Armatimonadota bacterium]MDR7469933.1 type III pantothenate kinase [Armatimonadota bacterium]MDR7474618.1 type III pantothenate kinase [Armatimonadota bacterium]
MSDSLLLALDINNTQIKIGLYAGADLLHHWRVATDREKTADEYAMLLRALFASVGRSLEEVSGVGISSVVPPLLDTMDRLSRTYLRTVPLVVGPGVRTGMRILYENPKEVGADRICNAVAAYARYGGPAIVVDLGTATTFSVVSAEGDFLGGAIAPGIGISVDALAEHAAQLHRVELVRPRQAIGRSTVAAMQAGILFGFVGQVEELLRRMREELGTPAVAIATGGWAELILPELRTVQHHAPLLGLEGLRIIYERNREAVVPLREERVLRGS